MARHTFLARLEKLKKDFSDEPNVVAGIAEAVELLSSAEVRDCHDLRSFALQLRGVKATRSNTGFEDVARGLELAAEEAGELATELDSDPDPDPDEIRAEYNTHYRPDMFW